MTFVQKTASYETRSRTTTKSFANLENNSSRVKSMTITNPIKTKVKTINRSSRVLDKVYLTGVAHATQEVCRDKIVILETLMRLLARRSKVDRVRRLDKPALKNSRIRKSKLRIKRITLAQT
jgi:hypothetical protein